MPSNNYIYKMSNAGGMATVTRYTDMLAGNTTWVDWEPAGAYDSLANVTLSAANASIVFAGIPAGYKHLQLRMLVRSASTGGSMRLNFNGDGAGTNYSRHVLNGDGSSATSSGAFGDSVTAAIGDAPTSSFAANIFGAYVIDILDYASITKNKTIRSLSGNDANGSGQIQLRSSGWYSTSAVTSINIYEGAGSNLAINSSFALYGVK
jgi:hypothetical protein